MKHLRKFLSGSAKGVSSLLTITITVCVLGAIIVCAGYIYLDQQLPDVDVLKNVQFQVPLRIYTNDGKLIAEYGEKRRIPVSLSGVPKQLQHAFIATEDQRFYEHVGVDPKGLMRAAFVLVTTGKKVQGGSTITMQVARNFFLTRKKTYSRKFKEILLALKINRELSKDKILELYLNKIYLGNRAYGVAAAAKVYYGKKLDQLTLPQMAMIAGLPKAPSSLNPLANPVRAKDRRDHVLERMYEQHYIDENTYKKAVATPLSASYHGQLLQVKAPYVAEMVRNTVYALFGNKAYTLGLNIYTTINSKDQIAANKALRKALLQYTERHGYRGSEQNLGTATAANLPQWQASLAKIPVINGLLPAAVISINDNDKTVSALLADDQTIIIPWDGLSWARPQLKNDYLGPTPKEPSDIVKVGDVIRVASTDHGWRLEQAPQVEGALVALNPVNGAIEALVGGFDYKRSKFNRVTQAERQPGSSFKPFIYSAALAKGYTLATVINDAPVVFSDPSQESLWRPQNDTRKFYGPTRIRVGLINSRNLVSIRILEMISIPYALDYVSRFGFDSNNLPHSLSLALGSATVTPLEMSRGYATFANGGYRITPFFIDRIDNSQGQEIFKAQPKVACETCNANNPAKPDLIPQLAPRAITAQNAYLMTSAMQDVIKHGTGRRAKVLKRSDLAGKTGTTNNQVDAWFAGFNSDLVTVAWVGFDKPKTIHEYGSKAALPMWIDFMKVALAGKPEHTMPEPPDIVSVRINKLTGLPADAGQNDTMFELFRKETVPHRSTYSNNAAQSPYDSSNTVSSNNTNNVNSEPNADQLF